jgi:hypothetical protein
MFSYPSLKVGSDTSVERAIRAFEDIDEPAFNHPVMKTIDDSAAMVMMAKKTKV